MEGVKKGRTKIRNDIIFIAVLLALAFSAWGILVSSRATGDTVTVTVDGELFGEYPLASDRTVEIRTGEGANLLVIEGGSARVTEATCPDGICVSHRAISRDGESIICLPNKVVVTVRKSGTDSPDIVV